MTAEELIKILEMLPKDTDVRIPDEGGYPELVRWFDINPYPDLDVPFFIMLRH